MTIPKVSDIIGIVNKIAPFDFAEEWDTVGLQVGDTASPVSRIMVSLDPGIDALETAIDQNCTLLLSHHPLLFNPLKKIAVSDPVGRVVTAALKHDVSVVSLHTNYDIAEGGINDLLAERLCVEGCEPLKTTGNEELVKLAVFVPKGHEEKVLDSLFSFSGFSGFIGNYRDCSFRSHGTGTFKPLEGARPFLGEVGRREQAEEVRIEILLRRADIAGALNAMFKVHPYEEPAFDLYPLLNQGKSRGLGRIGRLADGIALAEFASGVKERLCAAGVRFVGPADRIVRKVALCGGSGMSLFKDARFRGADVLVTGDIKYHEAREAEALGMALVDAGHFATERLMVQGLAKRLSAELIQRKMEAEIVEFAGEREPFSYL